MRENPSWEKRDANADGKTNAALEKSGLFRIFALAFGRTEVRQIQLDSLGKQNRNKIIFALRLMQLPSVARWLRKSGRWTRTRMRMSSREKLVRLLCREPVNLFTPNSERERKNEPTETMNELQLGLGRALSLSIQIYRNALKVTSYLARIRFHPNLFSPHRLLHRRSTLHTSAA